MWPNLVHNCTIFLCSLDVRNIVQGGRDERSFPRMEVSDSLSRTLGMDFFYPMTTDSLGAKTSRHEHGAPADL